MPTNIGQEFVTQIPSLSDDANIQQAFRLYHYGIATEPDQGTPISPNSIEAHLQTLAANIENIAEGQAVVNTLDAENLNDVVSTGVYQKSTTPSSGLNYPALSAGLLNVVATTGAIYQTYQTIGGATGSNIRFWRGRTASTTDWSDWKQAAPSTHIHDDRYYTETEINAKINTSLSANAAVVTDASGKIISSSVISVTELETLNNVTSNIQTQLNDRYTKSETARVFVKDPATGNPSGAVAGDLWFW